MLASTAPSELTCSFVNLVLRLVKWDSITS